MNREDLTNLIGIRLGNVDINDVEYYFATVNNFLVFIDKYLSYKKIYELIDQMSDEEKIALDIKYIHPDTHPATMIVEDELHRFVTDKQIKYWDDKPTVEDTTNWILDAIKNIKDGVTTELDTLNKIAIAIDNDPNFAVTIRQELSDLNDNIRDYFNNKIKETKDILDKSDSDINTRIDNLIDNAKLNTLNKLSTAINNDPDYHVTVSTNLQKERDAIDKILETKATIEYVDNEFKKLINNSPEVLDTLKEIADALGNDPNFSTTIINKIESYRTELTNKINTDVDNLKDNVISTLNTLNKLANAINNDPNYYINVNKKFDNVNSDIDALTKKHNTELTNLVDGATLNTLNKLSTAINNDANFNTTITNSISNTNTRIDNLLDNVKTDLNTLNKIAKAINNDANFNTTITNIINNINKTITDNKTSADATQTELTNFKSTTSSNLNTKVDKITGKGLSANDFTTTYKNKLDGIEANANKYTHPSTHAATMITTDTSHRFVSDSQITSWNAKSDVKRGSGNFAGSNKETTIAHGLGTTPSSVLVTPKANPGGLLGEYWARCDSTNIYVGNTGSATTAFYWEVVK